MRFPALTLSACLLAQPVLAAATVPPAPPIAQPGGTAPDTPVTQRAPTPFDDSTRGYAVGDLWNGPSGVLVATAVTPGAAVWVYQMAANLPLDTMQAQGLYAAGAYGTRKLRAAYGGKLINVVRASDSAAADIGFLFDGSLDKATLDAFCLGTSCGVATWYDQTGNNYNLTQSVAAARPAVDPRKSIGNDRTVVFNGNIAAGTTPKYFQLNGALNSAANNTSVLGLMRPTTVDHYNIAFQLNAGGSNPTYLWNDSATARSGVFFNGVDASLTPSVVADLDGIVGASAATTVYAGDRSTQIAAQPVTAYSSGWLGEAGDSGGSPGQFDCSAFYVYTTALTPAQVALLRSATLSIFGIQPQARANIIAHGDSLTESYGSTINQTWPLKLSGMLNYPAQVYDIGYYGIALAQRLAEYPTTIAPLFNPALRNNILVLWAGTNDNTGTDAACAGIYANATAYVAAAHATGFKIVLVTMMPRGTTIWDAAHQAEQQACAALQRANTAGADAIVDPAADPILGSAATFANGTYSPDGTHLQDVGYTMIAQMVAAAVNRLLVP